MLIIILINLKHGGSVLSQYNQNSASFSKLMVIHIFEVEWNVVVYPPRSSKFASPSRPASARRHRHRRRCRR